METGGGDGNKMGTVTEEEEAKKSTTDIGANHRVKEESGPASHLPW